MSRLAGLVVSKYVRARRGAIYIGQGSLLLTVKSAACTGPIAEFPDAMDFFDSEARSHHGNQGSTLLL